MLDRLDAVDPDEEPPEAAEPASIIDDATFKEYVDVHYQGYIKQYNRMASNARLTYVFIQWGLIIFSALTPILIVAGGEVERWSAAGISVLVAVGTAAMNTFKYQDNWINYRTICEALRREIHLFRARVPPYREPGDHRALFAERVEAIIFQENILWRTTVSAQRTTQQDTDVTLG